MGMYVSVLEWGHRLGIDEVFTGPCIFDLPPKILGSLGRPGCILSNRLGKCKFIPSIVNPHVVKPPKTMEQVGWVIMHQGWIKVGTQEICCACRLWITFGCLFLTAFADTVPVRTDVFLFVGVSLPAPSRM